MSGAALLRSALLLHGGRGCGSGISALLAQRPRLRIPGVFDPFECAVWAIVGPQFSLDVRRAFALRLLARVGESIDPLADGLTHLFPAPRTLAELDLKDLGLTSARAETVRALARAVCNGMSRFDEPAEEVTRALAKLPGIDPRTAQYVALRGLGDPDAFLPADLLLRRITEIQGPLSTPAILEARAERWRPWRGYAAMHLWAASAELASERPPVSDQALAGSFCTNDAC